MLDEPTTLGIMSHACPGSRSRRNINNPNPIHLHHDQDDPIFPS